MKNQLENPSVKLVVYFEEYLTFDTHMDKICEEINSALYHKNSVKNSLSIKVLIKLYFALIHPHIAYSLSIY